MGAETLLGHGDMLYLPPGTSLPTRVHGAFVSDQEVHRVVECAEDRPRRRTISKRCCPGPATPIPGLSGEDGEGGGAGESAEQDPLYDEAVRIVTERAQAVDLLRAAPPEDRLQPRRAPDRGDGAAGLVGPLQANGAREVLAPAPPED